jgi:hypothetical protein
MSEQWEKIFERLQQEKRDAAICPAVLENLANLKANRLKVQEMRTVAEHRLIELPSCIAANIEKFKSVVPEDIPALSRERIALEAEQAEFLTQVADVEGRILPLFADEEKLLKTDLAEAAKIFLRTQHKRISCELLALIINLVEPLVTAWQEYFDVFAREHGFPVDINTRTLLRELEIYSPILDRVIDGGLRPDLRVARKNYENSIIV